MTVAGDLVGRVVRHRTAEGEVAVRLTEVEAYRGADDPGSHAYRGPTPRTTVMFGPAGFAYVYFSYGMHWCANVVCGTEGTAAAVLLRAGEVVAGLELARSRRPAARRDAELARGPARLTRALGIGRAENGRDLCAGGPLGLHAGAPVTAAARVWGPRVGLSAGADIPWRVYELNSPTVSAYRGGGRRSPGPTT